MINVTASQGSSGTIPPGGNSDVVVSIGGTANTLAAGNYSDTVSFTNLTSGIGNTTRSVTLTIAVHPPITLSGFRFVTRTNIAMTLNGLPSHAYVIQRSANLSSWADILTITKPAGRSITFSNTVPTDFTKAFYRAREL